MARADNAEEWEETENQLTDLFAGKLPGSYWQALVELFAQHNQYVINNI